MKNKFFNIAILLLLLVNTVAIGYFFLRKPHHYPPHKQENAFDFLMTELHFTKEQVNACEKFKTSHRYERDSLGKAERETRDYFFSLLKNNNPTDSIVNKAVIQMGQIEEKKHISTFNLLKQIRAVCNDAQKTKFDGIFEKILKMNEDRKRMPPLHHHEAGRMPPITKGEDEEPENLPPPPHGEDK